MSLVKAIHDSDLEKVLKKLGIYEKLVNREYRCHICGEVLSLDNLGGLYKENGEIRLVCDKIECLVEAVERVKRSRYPMHK